MEINDILALPLIENITECCSIRRLGELPIIVINHHIGFAAIAFQGAHLLTWQPSTETNPVLWLSPKSSFEHKKPIRGGIPICWPWFCDKYKTDPFHGFARISTWELSDYQENQNSFQLLFTLVDNEETRTIWPFSFKLLASFIFSFDECILKLESLGEFKNTAALHTYFNIADINKVSILGTGKQYDDSVHGGLKELGDCHLTINKEIGAIFTNPETMTTLLDEQIQRRIQISHFNNSNVVIWNPWIKRSKNISDLPDNAYKTMLCIETACIDKLMESTKSYPGKLGVHIKVKSVK